MKYSVLFISTIFSLFVNFFTNGDVVVTQNIPSTITSNTSTTVELNIKKGDVKGFAKLEQELPDGFSALPLDIKGGSFSFDKQKVKIVWLTLPSSNEFKVTYTLKVDSKGLGKKTIGGKVYFLKNGEKKINEIAPSIVEVK